MGIFDDKAKELAGDRIAKEQEQKSAKEIFLAKERMVNSAMDIFLKNDLPNIMREYVAAAEKAHTKSIEIEIEGMFGKKKTVAYFAGNSKYSDDWEDSIVPIYITSQFIIYEFYTDKRGLSYYLDTIIPSVYGLYTKDYITDKPLFKMNSIEEMLSSLNLKFKEYLLTCL